MGHTVLSFLSNYVSTNPPLLASVFFFTVCVVKDSELLRYEATPLSHPVVHCHIPGDWNPRLHQSVNLKAHKTVLIQEINKTSVEHKLVHPIQFQSLLIYVDLSNSMF